MRATFAHEAQMLMESDADIHAPGAAVTAALCGHWDHEPPCPLAPHHTRAERVGDQVHVRILFAVEPEMELDIRDRIEQALVRGQLHGPNGVTGWRLQRSEASALLEDETHRAQRLAGG